MKFVLKSEEEPFEPTGYPKGPPTRVRLEFHGESFSEVLPRVQQFLEGCGFTFRGELNDLETVYQTRPVPPSVDMSEPE